jgi:hypothetical protein
MLINVVSKLDEIVESKMINVVYVERPIIGMHSGFDIEIHQRYKKNLTARSIILAHEYGHYLNWEKDFNYLWNEYWDYVHEYTLYSEKAAWVYAYQTLKECGWTYWDLFFKQMAWALGTYCDGMSEDNFTAFYEHVREACLNGPETLDKPELPDTLWDAS